ncbi:YeeE/YedE family protein [Taibaiella chishuiensis]|nr:YeeE/YedE thiosulfate transporter family protein [Taibaiella chishuiensis]
MACRPCAHSIIAFSINILNLSFMTDFLKQPWPWYVAGPLIGLTVPALLILGNKSFGISSSLRHICAACIPANIPFFKYAWKKEAWNLLFVAGIFLGGIIAAAFLSNPGPVALNPALAAELSQYGINDYTHLVPQDIFSWHSLLTLRGFLVMVAGGFLVGFGARYAGGCTSGHAIMGLSTLQLPSLVATICFMAGGFLMANLVLPFLLSL